jgi:predicted TIM-barrel fold metal-dependent hydrolase
MSSNVNTVDSHLHVFWPERYPFPDGPGYRPSQSEAAANPDAMGQVLQQHGVTHALLVQPGGYAFDNRAMIDTIAASEGRMKGIAGVDVAVSEAELNDLKRGGIVGVRLNLYSFDADVFTKPGVREFLDKCASLDLFVEVFATSAMWVTIAEPLRRSKARLIIEHMGWPDVSAGIAQPGFQTVLKLAGDADAAVKLTCGFRLSKIGFPYDDVTPYGQALLEAFGAERCLWGSDWPFLNPGHQRAVRYEEEYEAFLRWVPDASQRRTILWDTPARLFGFSG